MPGLTLFPASIIAGVLYDQVDSSVPFCFVAVTATLAALLMVAFFRRNRALDLASPR